MPRRPRGSYKTYIAYATTSGEGPLSHTKTMYWGGHYMKGIDGKYPPGSDRFYEFLECADGFEFNHHAETEMLLLAARDPSLIGKLFVKTLYVLETAYEKQERLKAARERRAWLKGVVAGPSKVSDSTPKSTPSDGKPT